MRKTIESVFGFGKKAVDKSTTINLEVKGYNEFISQASKADINMKDKIMYNSSFGKAQDSVYSIFSIRSLGSKKTSALQKIYKIVDRKNEGIKYLGSLDSLVEGYNVSTIEADKEIVKTGNTLVKLRQCYEKALLTQEVMKEEQLNNWDKTKNIFYSVFNPKKIKKNVDSEARREVYLEIKEEIATFERAIKYNIKVLNNKVDKSKELSRKKDEANLEILRVKEVNSKSDTMKNFYKKYLNRFNLALSVN